MKNIMNYEKRLLQDRMQLQQLIEESNINDTEMLRGKISHFQIEIEYMVSQLECLKESVENIIVTPAKSIELEIFPETIKERTVSKTAEQISEKIKTTSSGNSKDLEKTIGKSLMGIFASVLIFISLILFATLLLPYFNNTAKMITTYLLSFAFLGVGLFRLKKESDNKFYIALTGCGIGAVYISLLLSNMYFKAIGDIGLYVLICIWAVGVCYLAKIKNKGFQLIGQLGIMIAIFFGCELCVVNNDDMKFMALVVFYAISSNVFYMVHYDREFGKNLVHHIFNVINFGILYVGWLDIITNDLNGITIFLLLILVVNIALGMYSKLEITKLSFGIVMSMYVFYFVSILFIAIDDNIARLIIIYTLCMALTALIEWKKANTNIGKNVVIVVLIVFAAVALLNDINVFLHGIVPLLIIPGILLGFYRNNSVFKYCGLLLFFIFTWLPGISEVERLILGSVVVALTFYLIYKNKTQYSKKFKYNVHIIATWFIYVTVNGLLYELTGVRGIGDVYSYVAVTLFNIIMLKSIFGCNIETGEQEDKAVYNFINLMAMTKGMDLVDYGYLDFLHLIVILTTIGAFTINSKNLLDKRGNMYAGMYVGIKFTVLMAAILDSFNAVNYVISVACFALAILSIVIGFKGQYKALRIYGLMLSMFSTFKLIMVDINYSNTLGNALSFFASGILCFVISLIYNFIDKKMKKE